MALTMSAFPFTSLQKNNLAEILEKSNVMWSAPYFATNYESRPEWHFQPNPLSDQYLYKVFFTLPLWFRCFGLRDGIDGSPLFPWLRCASRRAPSPSPRRRRSTVCQLATRARSPLRR